MSQGLPSVHCNEAEGGLSHPGRGLARVGWGDGTPKGGNWGGNLRTGLILWIQGTGK